MNNYIRIVLIIASIFATNVHADVLTTNTWTITSSDNTSVTGTVTDTSIPGFSAEFTIARNNVVSFGDATWTGGPEINLLNDRDGNNPGTGDSLQLVLSFSNVVGGEVSGIVSEYGTTTNNDVDATWTYNWNSGDSASLLDPNGQMVEADGITFASGGLVTNATTELAAALHTWCVNVPHNSVTLDWASPTHAFAEAMAFRIQVAPVAPVAPVNVPIFAPIGIAATIGGLLWFGRRRKAIKVTNDK